VTSLGRLHAGLSCMFCHREIARPDMVEVPQAGYAHRVCVPLAQATTIQQLLDLGVTRGFTLWPEWGFTFTHLDKGGSTGHPGIENRPSKPPANLIGQRVAFHNGAHIGGRKGNVAALEGVWAVLGTAESAGWAFTGARPSALARRVNLGRGILSKGGDAVDFDGSRIVTSALTFTAVITGYDPPTDKPAHPWQFASDPEDSETWQYGWHVEDVIPLARPIPCAGLQGFWPLKSAKQPKGSR
jgi:hypothetical protein